ncbi:flavo protein-like protein [Aspergillus bertholletiae]|uniref:Flavo protein-like protein n=1 Tax=Aspergillus bertholletiae TaxID=1226010 RepID=A0A5N7BPF2_9EURO|nr:flavo protein-like protein [Aspergillus bertholletiae]
MPHSIPETEKLMDMFSLKGKVIVVTGASNPRGIGYEAARGCAEMGAAVAITYLTREEEAQQNVKTLAEEFNVNTRAYHCDITDFSSVEKMVQTRYGLGILLHLRKRIYWKGEKQSDNTHPTTLNPGRSILDIVQAKGKNCVIFYGSQTGTAENFASRLAKEGAERFGLRAMRADLDKYDYGDLLRWHADIVAFFILATYGEGEPIDNAVLFYAFSIDDSPLSSLRYAGFGLGNDGRNSG